MSIKTNLPPTEADPQSVWNRCLEIIRDNVSEDTYTIWFVPIVAVALEDSTLTIQVPTHLFFETLEKDWVSLLKKVIKRELGPRGKLKYQVLIEKTAEPSKNKFVNYPSEAVPRHQEQIMKPIVNIDGQNGKNFNPNILPGLTHIKIPSNLNPAYTFDNYIEGDCNRLARAAGWAIAQNPVGNNFNPLFIYSDVGLGKTHLVHAIGLQTKVNFPDKTVLYISADLFYQQFMEAVRNNNREDFIHFYQNIDVLIIDDIQFLATGNKERTQDALFHIFNHLNLRKKQIIITADKPPVEISGFESRLLNRFKWGLTADLQVPDIETRIAIIHKKLENYGATMPDEVINYLAMRITSNTRELEGAIITIMAQATLNHRDITEALAKEMIDKYVKNTAKEISLEYIQKVVSDFYHLRISDINENSRERKIVQARQICMHLARKLTKFTYKDIGKAYGGKNHATALHADNTINNLLQTDKSLRTDIEAIEKIFKN